MHLDTHFTDRNLRRLQPIEYKHLQLFDLLDKVCVGLLFVRIQPSTARFSRALILLSGSLFRWPSETVTVPFCESLLQAGQSVRHLRAIICRGEDVLDVSVSWRGF